jgi:hypothetical protein
MMNHALDVVRLALSADPSTRSIVFDVALCCLVSAIVVWPAPRSARRRKYVATELR